MINEKKDPDRVEGGYKAMGTSAGVSKEKAKRYLKSKKVKDRMKDVKKRAKGARDPEAYIASVERKMLKGHYDEELEFLLKDLTLEAGE